MELESSVALADTPSPSMDGAVEHYSSWLTALFDVIDTDTWETTNDLSDFDVRARLLDLILYIYIRSSSVLRQHNAFDERLHGQGVYQPSSEQRYNSIGQINNMFCFKRQVLH